MSTAIEWTAEEIRVRSCANWRQPGLEFAEHAVVADTIPGCCLAVHPARETHSAGRWTVTHRPSGMAVGSHRFASRELAREVALALWPCGDWHKTAEEICADGALIAAARRVVQQLGFDIANNQYAVIPDEATGLTKAVPFSEFPEGKEKKV